MARNLLSDIFKRGNPMLLEIFKETERLKVLNMRLALVLDETMLPHTQVATLKGTTLCLMADSGLVATRLRYDSQKIIRKCKAIPELCGVSQVEIKVTPIKEAPPPAFVQRQELSPERKAWLSALVSQLKLSKDVIKKRS